MTKQSISYGLPRRGFCPPRNDEKMFLSGLLTRPLFLFRSNRRCDRESRCAAQIFNRAGEHGIDFIRPRVDHDLRQALCRKVF